MLDTIQSLIAWSWMGVPAFHTNRFTAAKQYAESLTKQQAGGGPPVRRDLELETIAENIRGTPLIHCHSYRQDEVEVFLQGTACFRICSELIWNSKKLNI